VIFGLALAHVGLENLDLLVQESQLVIPADKLRTEDIPLVDDLGDLLLLDLVVVVEFADDQCVARQLALQVLYNRIQILIFCLFRIHLVFVLVRLLPGNTELMLT